jgi:hypothetical protein
MGPPASTSKQEGRNRDNPPAQTEANWTASCALHARCTGSDVIAELLLFGTHQLKLHPAGKMEKRAENHEEIKNIKFKTNVPSG